MSKYHKIQSLYLRDPETKFKTFLDEYARPEFGLLHDKPWHVDEKIDGTNIRVYLDPASGVTFGGRTDNAQIPAPLVSHLVEMFAPERLREVFPSAGVVLYGEGFGRKIQEGGGNYIPDGVSFALFDVRVGDIWLERASVADIAARLQIDCAPRLGLMTLDEAEEMVRGGFDSRIAKTPGTQAEGVVLRPLVELFGRRGHRVITKLKTKDYVR